LAERSGHGPSPAAYCRPIARLSALRSRAAYQRPFLAAAGIVSYERVLDIGCGTGQTTRDAARLASSEPLDRRTFTVREAAQVLGIGRDAT
jgi:SAM-dependent methyltransferase